MIVFLVQWVGDCFQEHLEPGRVADIFGRRFMLSCDEPRQSGAELRLEQSEQIDAMLLVVTKIVGVEEAFALHHFQPGGCAAQGRGDRTVTVNLLPGSLELHHEIDDRRAEYGIAWDGGRAGLFERTEK